MGIVKRQSIKSMVITYVALVFGYLNLAYFFPKLFSPEQIGLVSFLLGTSNLLLAVVQLGMPSTVVRYKPVIREMGVENRFLRFSVWVPFVAFLVLFGLLYFAADWIIDRYYSEQDLIKAYYHLLPVFTLSMAFLGIWAAHSRSLLRIVVPNLIEKLGVRLLVLAFLLLFSFSLITFHDFVWLYAWLYVAAMVAVMIYYFALRPLKERINEPEMEKGFVQKMLAFGGFSFLTILGNQVVENIDIMMLSSMSGLADAGIYKIAFYIGGVIMIPMGALAQIAAPVFAEAWNNNDMDKVREMYQKSSINLTIAGALLFVGIYINIDNIFEIMPNGELFQEGKNVILWIAVSKLISMVFSVNSPLLANSRYYMVNVISILVLAVLTVLTNYIFIPVWGIVGAAFASAMSLVIFNLIKFLFIAYQFKMLPFTNKTVPALLLMAAVIGINLLLPELDNIFVDIIYRSVIATVVFATGVVFFKLSEDVNTILQRYRQ